MTKATRGLGSRTMSRRAFVAGTVAAAAGMVPGVSQAQSAIDDLLKSSGRGNWDDQFDTRGSNTVRVASNEPVFSANTVSSMQQAMDHYRQIVGAGGWPMVPDQAKLQLGVQDASVTALRQRLRS